MKHNLKTFPNPERPTFATQVLRWKKYFTEELQQLKGIAVLDDDGNEIDQLISKKEVLGEN